jgi:plastocyanin
MLRPACISGLIILSITTLSYTGFAAPPAEEAFSSSPEEEIAVRIQARQFEPAPVILHAGRKTRLVFLNQDVELHAFVPVGLFTGTNVMIGGNGAPEFGEDGFKRIIIPSNGRAEIRFTPERRGVYPFFCDMPGHEMKAAIIVE